MYACSIIFSLMPRFVIVVALMSLAALTHADGISQLRQQAQSGDREAQFQLAEKLYKGDGTSRNYAAAVKWYRAAAGQGHPGAQYQMGYMHQHGPSLVQKDARKAFEWYLKAAEQGHVPSQTKVSLMYATGKGVEKNMALSRKWSAEVLKSKGLLDDDVDQPVQKPRSKPAAARPPAKKPTQKPTQNPVQNTTRTITRNKPESAAGGNRKRPAAKKIDKVPNKQGMTEEQYKAWRREQARKLVEKMNREAAGIEDWSDVE